MIFDPLWLLFVVPGVILGIYAQIKLSSAYGKYSRVEVQSGLTGAEAARRILDQAGLTQMPIEEIGGRLTDHYDPARRALFLSTDNFRGRSIAAVGVAAHESGHALQQQAAYAPMQFRMAIVPLTQFASYAWMGLLGLGWVLGRVMFYKFAWVAVAIFTVMALFQVVTLPVEYDASRRAKVQLSRLGIVSSQESPAINKVLNAAALTYVAGMVTAIMQLLYFLTLTRNRN